jgi:hypothetical protein
VNQADYEVWRANFGMGTAAGGAAAVPEPTSIAMLLVCLSIAAAARRQR